MSKFKRAQSQPAPSPPAVEVDSGEPTAASPVSPDSETAPVELAGASPVAEPSAESPAVAAPADLPLRVEAILMATDRALSAAKLAEVLGKVGTKAFTAAVAELNRVYEETGRSFRVEAVAGGWQILTLPVYAQVVAAWRKSRESTRLTPAALESLAIIAYKQPITRAEVEAIRGVASGEVIRTLLERHLVKIVGRAEELGRPMLYGTTRSFLEVFGLASLKDLPKAEELRPQVLAPKEPTA